MRTSICYLLLKRVRLIQSELIELRKLFDELTK